MDERQQGMWDKLCRLDGETVARLLTDYHGTQLLSDGFREFLQNEGYLEESPEEEGCHAAASIIEVLQGTVSREAALTTNSAGITCAACGRPIASTIIWMWIRRGMTMTCSECGT